MQAAGNTEDGEGREAPTEQEVKGQEGSLQGRSHVSLSNWQVTAGDGFLGKLALGQSELSEWH